MTMDQQQEAHLAILEQQFARCVTNGISLRMQLQQALQERDVARKELEALRQPPVDAEAS